MQIGLNDLDCTELIMPSACALRVECLRPFST